MDKTIPEFNSLIPNEERCEITSYLFYKFTKYIEESKIEGIRLRGLRVTMQDTSMNINFCEAEFLCREERALVELCSVI